MIEPRLIDAVALARYISDESPPAEVARIEEWLRGDPVRAAEFEEVRRAWSLARANEPAIDSTAAWQQVRHRMRATAPAELGASADGTAPPTRHRWQPATRSDAVRPSRRVLLAAGLAAIAAGSLVAVRIRTATQRQALVAIRRDTTQYATGPGQRALVQLADGTQIALAPESHLRYVHPRAGRGPRDAYLIGEAVFVVSHDVASPFLVHTKGAVTVDVGTRFGVRAYAAEPLRVAVAEGRVALADDAPHADLRTDSTFASLQNATFLGAGDIIVRAADGTDTVRHGEDVDGLLGWVTGRLRFNHVRLGALIPELERWYGLTVRVSEPALLDQRISGQFESETRDEMVRAIATALGARYTRHGTTVTFAPGLR